MTGQATMVITDEQALLAWVESHHPGEVVVAVTVDPVFLDALRDRARTQGLGPVTDSTGAVIPGIRTVEAADAD